MKNMKHIKNIDYTALDNISFHNNEIEIIQNLWSSVRFSFSLIFFNLQKRVKISLYCFLFLCLEYYTRCLDKKEAFNSTFFSK